MTFGMDSPTRLLGINETFSCRYCRANEAQRCTHALDE